MQNAGAGFRAEGGEGCAVALNVGRLSCSRRFAGKVSFILEGKLPHRLRRSSLAEGAFCKATIFAQPRGLRWAKTSAPRRMLAFVETALNACILGIRASSSREQRDRRILRGVQTRRGALCASVSVGFVFSFCILRVHGVRPYGFDEKADRKCWRRSPHPPRAVPLPRWGRLGLCPYTSQCVAVGFAFCILHFVIRIYYLILQKINNNNFFKFFQKTS